MANRLILRAGTNISGIEITANELTEATSTHGSITLTDADGVGEQSTGLRVLSASAPEGAISITANGGLFATEVSAGGSTSGIKLTAIDGPLAVLNAGATDAALTSNTHIELHGSDITWTGTATANGTITVVASGDVSIVSGFGNVSSSAIIGPHADGTLDSVNIAAAGNLDLLNGSISRVTTKLALRAGREMAADLNPVSWIVTGENGEIDVSVGGDLTILSLATLQADARIAIASTGYVDDAHRSHGGTLSVIGTPGGLNTTSTKQLVLTAENYLHVTQKVPTAENLTLGGPNITINRQAVIRPESGAIITDGGDDRDIVSTLVNQRIQLIATLTVANLHLTENTRFTHGILLVTGNVVADGSVAFQGASLGGSGSLNKPVTFGNEATLLPGLSTRVIEDLQLSSVTLQDGTHLDFDFSATEHDQIHVAGTLTIGRNVTISTATRRPFAVNGDDRFVLIHNDGNEPVVGRFAGLPFMDFLGSGSRATIIYDGGNGNDKLTGGKGNDELSGGDGNDTLNGGTGTDRLVETITADNATLTNTSLSGLGFDTLTSIESVELFGNARNNMLDASRFTLGRVKLHGLDGNDTLLGTSLNDVLDGGNGSDLVKQSSRQAQTLADTSLTGSGSDTLSSIERAELTDLSTTGNTIDASTFNGLVTLTGGNGPDRLLSSILGGVLNGGAGQDTLIGGAGLDTINGGAGNDTINGAAGADSISGSDGHDKIFGGDGDDIINGGAGNDIISGAQGNDRILGGSGHDAISGGGGRDFMDGQDGNDTLLGGADDDTLICGAGYDIALGEEGNDRIEPPTADTISGGPGENVFVGPHARIDEAFVFDHLLN